MNDYISAKGEDNLTPEKVNKWFEEDAIFGHDAINHYILVKARAERLGVYGSCTKCKEEGYIIDSEDTLALVLWILHPRKGASRGIHIKSIKPEQLPEVKAFLKRSHEWHLRHFKWCI